MISPIVSIIIPVFNRGSRVAATVNSVQGQTISSENYELIIVDDGSTDETFRFLRTTYGHLSHIRLLRQENRGVAAARNRGLREARGEYIAFLDHDDLWLPAKLEEQLRALKENPRAAVAYCRWRDVDENGDSLPEEQQTTQQSWWQPREGRVHDWFCAPRNPIVSMSVPLIRTAALHEVGGFDPGMVPSDDLDLWLRLSHRYEFVYVPQELVLYVHHARQQGSDPGRTARAMRRVYSKHWRCLMRHPSMLWYVAFFRFFLRSAEVYQEAKRMVSTGQRKRFIALVARTFCSNPLALLAPQWIVLLGRALCLRSEPDSRLK